MSPATQIADLKAELERAQSVIAALLHNAGEPGTCKACKQPVTFVRHLRTGRSGIYDPDGRSHFATCPQAEKFRRRAQPPPTKEGETNA